MARRGSGGTASCAWPATACHFPEARPIGGQLWPRQVGHHFLDHAARAEHRVGDALADAEARRLGLGRRGGDGAAALLPGDEGEVARVEAAAVVPARLCGEGAARGEAGAAELGWAEAALSCVLRWPLSRDAAAAAAASEPESALFASVSGSGDHDTSRRGHVESAERRCRMDPPPPWALPAARPPALPPRRGGLVMLCCCRRRRVRAGPSDSDGPPRPATVST